MPCFPFFCGRTQSDPPDPPHPSKVSSSLPLPSVKPLPHPTFVPHPPSDPYATDPYSPGIAHPRSPSSPSSSSIPPYPTSHLPSITTSPSHTTTHLPPYSSTSNLHPAPPLDPTPHDDSHSRDDAIKAAFTTPLPTRRLPPPPPIPSSTSPSTSTTNSDSSREVSPPRNVPSLPPPHPHRRQSTPLTQPGCGCSAPQCLPSISPQSLPPTFSSSQPSTPTHPRTPSHPPAPQSTPLRARRLQRHRAISQSSPHSSIFPRTTQIAQSPALRGFFASHAAAVVMAERLQSGGIFLHHEAGQAGYKHVYASQNLTHLYLADLQGVGGKAPTVLTSAVMKAVKGLSTRLLIEKASGLIEGGGGSGGFPVNCLMSLVTVGGSVDLECTGEIERDEWCLTFDWLIYQWNLRGGGGEDGVQVRGVEGRKPTWLGGLVGLFELQERMLRHAKVKGVGEVGGVREGRGVGEEVQRVVGAGRPRMGGILSERELYGVLGSYVNDIEAVREANRALLVEDCQAMIEMQRKIDEVREENAKLIEDMRPAVD